MILHFIEENHAHTKLKAGAGILYSGSLRTFLIISACRIYESKNFHYRIRCVMQLCKKMRLSFMLVFSGQDWTYWASRHNKGQIPIAGISR